jgi:predicted nucleic-acid-binding protein
MTAVDTNVLFRRLLNDDATQAEKARRLLETRESVLVAEALSLGRWVAVI